MAHSAAAATAASAATATGVTTGEINYFFQDENGKILKVLKQAEIKEEPMERHYTTTTAGGGANSNAYTQLSASQAQFVKIPSTYNIQSGEVAAYSMIAPQQQQQLQQAPQQQQQQQQQQFAGNTIKFESLSPMVKSEPRYTKFVAQQPTPPAQPSGVAKSTKAKMHNACSTSAAVQRKRKPEKAGKGLRHFSMKVCEKVKEKGTTNYNEVADELVAEELQNNSFDAANCDQKNIRRRVYDALNVLMAMKIISKDKKEIRWIGLTSESAEKKCETVEVDNDERRKRIKQKRQQLCELILQLVSFKSLIQRNREAERRSIIPTPNSSIQLPFIIVNTHKTTKINCSVTNDKSEYIFKFDEKFEMHDDAEVLKRMGLLNGLDKGQCSFEDIERAKTLVPPNFQKYIEAYGRGRGLACVESDEDCVDDELPSFIELANSDSQEFAGAGGVVGGVAGEGVGVHMNIDGGAGVGGGSLSQNDDSLALLDEDEEELIEEDEEFLENSDID